MTAFLVVFLGAGFGGMLRQAVNVLAMRLPTELPWHTFAVNVVGSLVLGLLVGWLTFKGEVSQFWRLFLITGVLGGFTTFSAFSFDAVLLWERGQQAASLAYVVVTVALSIAGLLAGLWLGRA